MNLIIELVLIILIIYKQPCYKNCLRKVGLRKKSRKYTYIIKSVTRFYPCLKTFQTINFLSVLQKIYFVVTKLNSVPNHSMRTQA
jgi:hypothetical protein